MSLVDWIVVIILGSAVIGGLFQGFFRSVCGLLGLIAGLVVAAWNYARLALFLMPLLRIPAIANTISFLLISVVVMALFAVVGNLLAKALRMLGLGCLDSIAGGVFGFFQGAMMVVIGILVVVAFFPQEHWIAEARIPRMFFGVCHVSTSFTPDELARRVRAGLAKWETESPEWLRPAPKG